MNIVNCKCGKAWNLYILLDGIPSKCRTCKNDLVFEPPLYIRGEQDGGWFFFTFIFAALTIYGLVSGDKHGTEMILAGLALGGLCFLIGLLPYLLRGGIRVEQDSLVLVSFTKKETKFLFDDVGVIRARAVTMPGPGIGPRQYKLHLEITNKENKLVHEQYFDHFNNFDSETLVKAIELVNPKISVIGSYKE